MTKISIMHGNMIPVDELRDRSVLVPPAPYIPSSQLNSAELQLLLLQDEANILAKFYQDRAAEKAVSLLQDALYGRPGKKYYGVLPDKAMKYVRAIETTQKMRRQIIVAGSGQNKRIGDNIPPVDCKAAMIEVYNQRYGKSINSIDVKVINNLGVETVYTLQNGTWKVNLELSQIYTECKGIRSAQIEVIYNRSLIPTSHHLLYEYVPEKGNLPAAVITKRILHKAGVEELSRIGFYARPNMSQWLNNGIMRQNIQAGTEPFTGAVSGFILSGLPESELNNYLSSSPYTNPTGINPVVATAIAITTAVAAAVTAAAKLLAEVKQKQENAMKTVTGYGTQAFSAQQNDWGQGSGNSGGNNLLLLAGLAAGAYLLIND